MNLLRNILPEYMAARFSIEQLSLMDIACDSEITNLYAQRVAALDNHDDTVSIQGIDRRIRVLRRAQRTIREVITE